MSCAAAESVKGCLKTGAPRVGLPFRDQGGSNSFAYSTDVTGRNIAQPRARTEWRFEAVIPYQDVFRNCEEVLGHLSRLGFYIFER